MAREYRHFASYGDYRIMEVITDDDVAYRVSHCSGEGSSKTFSNQRTAVDYARRQEQIAQDYAFYIEEHGYAFVDTFRQIGASNGACAADDDGSDLSVDDYYVNMLDTLNETSAYRDLPEVKQIDAFNIADHAFHKAAGTLKGGQ